MKARSKKIDGPKRRVTAGAIRLPAPSASVLILALSGVLVNSYVSVSRAAPPLPPGTLPVPTANWVSSGQATRSTAGNTLTINQSTASAILNWQTFNIANGSAVNFLQPNASSAALNRIFDANPSVIQGMLTANGQIYLINHNGIIFDGTSQINVGSLVASSLDISDSQFNNGILSNPNPATTPVFCVTTGGCNSGGAAYTGGFVRVESGAQLTAYSGGRIMLLAPNVQNNGVISTPDGQTILAAGQKVYLAASTDPALRGLLVEVDNGGSAENLNLGHIITERGNATLVGLAVNQAGRISATTSVNENGSIRLLARDTVQAQPLSVNVPQGSRTGTVVLASGSVTEVRPDLTDTQTITNAQTFSPSSVEIAGKTINFQSGSSVVATGGTVTVTAQDGLQFQSGGAPASGDARIYMDAGSSIDVSGSMNVPIPASRNLVQAQLRGTELANSPLQRNGFLYGKTVTVDIRKGTPVADVSGYISQISHGINELTAVGGSVTMKSEGDVVLRQGSSINVSGGSLQYLPGYLQTTQLVGADGRIYDIGSAPANIIYTGFANTYSVTDPKWGVTQTWTTQGNGQYTPGYTEGKDAGTFTLVGHGLVLDGDLEGTTNPGQYQRFATTTPGSTTLPQGGQLIIGDATGGGQFVPLPDYFLPDVIFALATSPLPASYTFSTAGTPTPVALSTEIFGDGGFTRAQVYSNGRILVPAGTNIALAPGGSLTLVGREIDVNGGISAPGGTVKLTTNQTFGPLLQTRDYSITVAPGSQIRASGMWVNDVPALNGSGTDPVLINGGTVSIQSVSDLTLNAGSVVDVSGGGWVQSSGTLQAGNAGSITLQTGRLGLASANQTQLSTLTLDGELRAYALSSGLPGLPTGSGGKLTLNTSNVTIGGVPAGATGELWLPSGFFAGGGFKDYAVTGQDGVTVTSGTTITPLAASDVLGSNYAGMSTGTDINSFSQHAVLPIQLRTPGSIALTAGSLFDGDLSIGAGSTLRVDPTGQINLTAGRQLTVLGALDAPAGAIALSTLPPGTTDVFNPGQSVWLGSGSSLSAAGYFMPQFTNNGLRQGVVLAGGSISISAGKGYVVMQQGALADVSGTSATLDIKQTTGNQTAYVPTSVAGDAGSIALSAREGMMIDGKLLGAPGSTSVFGGSLSLGFNYLQDLVGYPRGPRQTFITQSGTSVPANLTPGLGINSALNGIISVSADTISRGGFDNVSVQSHDVITFNGNVNLAVRRALTLDAPILADGPVVFNISPPPSSLNTPNVQGTGSSTVNLAGASVALGNSNSLRQSLLATSIDQQVSVNGLTTGLGGGTLTPTGLTTGLGMGTLNVDAKLIDVVGNSVTSGFGTLNLTSAGDVRLQGVINGPSALALTGGLMTAANLTMQAAQVYPTTLSQFNLTVQGNPTGTITILAGGTDTPVYSAAGQLTITAPNIVQNGVLKAPFGQIDLQASNALTLGAGSVTSISAQGQIIPFGATQLSGIDYTYTLPNGNTIIVNNDNTNKGDITLAALTNKSIILNGKSVTIYSDPNASPATDNSAKINVAGGGDLYAYEFTAGPGGTKDVLAPANSPNTYAILPGLQSAFAPVDPQYSAGVSGLKTGDSIYLSGMNGLLAGVYTLLPARYGLLPGAFLVTAKSGTNDLQAGSTMPQLDGSQLIAGYRTAIAADGSLIRDSRVSGFVVEPGIVARTQSAYTDTYFSKFFAGSTASLLPGDAGRLAISATTALDLGGNLITDHAAGARGAAVDITATNLAVVSPGGAAVDPSAVQIDADRLDHLNASSVLLGGTRALTANGEQITVGANAVTIANTSDHPLTAPEILLAANNQVTVTSGADIQAAGDASGAATSYYVGATGVSGNGALVRVSAGPQALLTRTNVDLTTGQLTVESGATVAAQSIILDATHSNQFSGTINLPASGGALALGAQRVSAGETSGVDNTLSLVLSNDQIAKLGNPSQLALTSYTTLDLYGGATLGSAGAGSVTIDAAGIGGYLNAGDTATITAQTVTLLNSNASGFVNAPALNGGSVPAFGSGALQLNAQQVTLGSGTFQIKGFGSTTIAATREIVGSGTGALSADANLNLQATRLTTVAGAQTSIASVNGTLALTQPATLATDLASAAIGGQLSLTGQSVSDSGRIDLPSGTLTLHATGPVGAGDVSLGTGAQINAGGVTKVYFDTTATAPGGQVTLTSDNGGVTIGSGATIDVSGADGGDAGILNVNATNGMAQLLGTLKGGANALAGQAAPQQGQFNLDAKTLADYSAMNAQLSPVLDGSGRIVTGGFTDTQNLRIRSGSVSIGSATDITPTTVTAKNFQLAVDDGNIDVYGTINASGGKGGSIALLANQAITPSAGVVTVHSGALLNASATDAVTTAAGTDGQGGSVFLSTAASSGSINVKAGSTIDVSAAGAATGGTLLLRAPRNAAGNDVPVTLLGTVLANQGQVNQQGQAQKGQVVVEGDKVYNATTISGTGATDGVNFNASTSGTAYTEAEQFLTNTIGNNSGVLARLSASAASNFHLRPGVEVDSSGDLTVSINENSSNTSPGGGWNLNTWRFTNSGATISEPGVLTLRAAGNLNINSSIGDGFTFASNKLMRDWTTVPSISANGSNNSWSYRLIAGADGFAADPLAVIKGSGNFNLAGDNNLDDNKLIRTGNGTIQIAAGGDINLEGAGSVIYTVGVPGPVLSNFTVPNFNGFTARYTVQGGDISVTAGGNINAVQSDELVTGWLFRQGTLDSNGNLSKDTSWWTRFDQFRQGIGALGGGDIRISAGGDIVNLGAVIPTNGRLPGAVGTVPNVSTLAVQGGGDLTVRSGGNIESGLYYVAEGSGHVTAAGSLTNAPGAVASTILAIGDGNVKVQAGQNIDIGAVFNPTVLPESPNNLPPPNTRPAPTNFFTYTANSALLLSAGGSITLANNRDDIQQAVNDRALQLTMNGSPLLPLFSSLAENGSSALTVYPGTVSAATFNGDINVTNTFALYPAANGNLSLLAAGSVVVNDIINMSDVNPANLPQFGNPTSDYANKIDLVLAGSSAGLFGNLMHSNPPLHASDTEPVRIYAAGGSVIGSNARRVGQFPKQVRVMAAVDVQDFSIYGQNVGANDVTSVQAGRDVTFTTSRDALGNQLPSSGGIEIGGPGQVEIMAGRNVDLGNSSGIVTRGNLNNPYLPPAQGASITAVAGTSAIAVPATFVPDLPLTTSPYQFTKADLGAYVRSVTGDSTITDDQARAVYNALPADKQLPFFLQYFYLALRDTGRAAATNGNDYSRGYDAIAAAFPAGSYQGDIKLFFSQITTQQGGDINLLAPGGLVNAGLANPGNNPKPASQLGIITVNGGSIKAFVRDDFLVNQSRVFTLAGGDILIWSSDGNIDAGKGAKTASATPPPLLVIDSSGRVSLDTTQSVAGSGIGVLLAKEGVVPGDVDLIAPRGSVNAGDAGIRVAGNLTIASPRVIGADNIQVGGKSTGVPVADSAGAGAASAASAASATSGSTRSADDIARNAAASAQTQAPTLGTSFITVEILGFGEQ